MTKEEFKKEMQAFMEDFGDDFAQEFDEVQPRIAEFAAHDPEFGRLLNLLVQDFANLRAHVQSRMS